MSAKRRVLDAERRPLHIRMPFLILPWADGLTAGGTRLRLRGPPHPDCQRPDRRVPVACRLAGVQASLNRGSCLTCPLAARSRLCLSALSPKPSPKPSSCRRMDIRPSSAPSLCSPTVSSLMYVVSCSRHRVGKSFVCRSLKLFRVYYTD